MPCLDCSVYGKVCWEVGNPNYGFSSFDHLGWGTLSVFQVITLEGWTELLDVLMDVSPPALVFPYFVVLVTVGAFFLTNYLLAQVCLVFQSKLKVAKKLEEKEKQEKRKVAGMIGKLRGGKPKRKEQPMFTVNVVGARGLPRMDLVSSDPYAVVNCGGEQQRTRTLRSTLTPEWNENMQFLVPEGTEDGMVVTVEVFDEDFGSKDQPIGKYELKDLTKYPKEGGQVFDEWFTLEQTVGAEKREAGKYGEVHLKLSWQIKGSVIRAPERKPEEKSNCERFLDSDWMGRLINFCIVSNFILLAVDYHGMPAETADILEIVNVILTWVFTVEFMIRLPVMGAVRFWAEPFNRLDAFVVITSQVELWMAWLGGGEGGAMSGLRAFRLLRILRSLKLINNVGALRDMMATTAGSLQAIRDFAILLMIMLYIYALTGLTLFGGSMRTPDGEIPRTNFDDLLWSFTTVFVVMTRENWQAVLYDSMYANGELTAVYFISLIVLTNYVLLALFIGTLLENFERFFLAGAEEDAKKEEAAKLKHLTDGGDEVDMKSLTDVGDATSTGGLLVSAVPGAKQYVETRGGTQARAEPQPEPEPEPEVVAGLALQLDGVQPEALEDGSSSPHDVRASVNAAWRKKAQDIAYHGVFEAVVLFAIVISSGALAVEHPMDDKESTKIQILSIMDTVFVVFFTFEMLIKFAAMGFIGKGGYFRSGWNWIDFVIVVSALFVKISGSEGGLVRAIRAVRILRPLRAIQRSRGMRMTVAALLGSVPAILTVSGCILFFCSIVAILCVGLFKGTMFHCTDGDRFVLNECVGSAVLESEMSQPVWQSAPQNFDDFFSAMLTLFEIFSLEAWPDIMTALVDATDVNHGPRLNNQPGVVFLFIILIMLGSFFLMNLFVGVIVTAYNEAQKVEVRNAEEGGEIDHASALELVHTTKPVRFFTTDNYMRKKLVLFVTQPKFELAIMSCIVLNVLVMCVDTVDISPDIVEVTEIINVVFTWIFTAECVVKMIALDWHYFCDLWNLFDFIVVSLSLFEMMSDIDFPSTLIRIFRVFRLARLLKLSRKAKGVQTLMRTFKATMPSLMHVGFLLMIFFFMYAVLGVQLFFNVKYGDALSDHADFSSFGGSLYTLFRIATGENWNIVMHDMMVQPPHCTPAEDAADGFGDCGSPLGAAIYAITFTLLCSMTTLNLIIAVILYAFFDMSEEELIDEDEVRAFFTPFALSALCAFAPRPRTNSRAAFVLVRAHSRAQGGDQRVRPLQRANRLSWTWSGGLRVYWNCAGDSVAGGAFR